MDRAALDLPSGRPSRQSLNWLPFGLDKSAVAGKGPRLELDSQQASWINRTRQQNLPRRHWLEPEATIVGLVTHENHEAYTPATGGIQTL